MAQNVDRIPVGEGNVPVRDLNVELNENVHERGSSKDLPAKLVDAKHYPVWALRMRLHFEALSVWTIVDGTASLQQKTPYKKKSIDIIKASPEHTLTYSGASEAASKI